MNSSPLLPNGYSIHIVKNYKDTWEVFKLLILRREREPNKNLNLTSVWVFFFGFLLCLMIFYFLGGRNTYWLLLATITFASFCMTTLIIYFMVFFNIVCSNIVHIENKSRRLVGAFYKGKLIGVSLLEFRRSHNVLLGLYVCPSHRKKGIGSFLSHYILRGIRNPVYVCALPGLSSFYKNLGFIESNERKGYNMVCKFDTCKK